MLAKFEFPPGPGCTTWEGNAPKGTQKRDIPSLRCHTAAVTSSCTNPEPPTCLLLGKCYPGARPALRGRGNGFQLNAFLQEWEEMIIWRLLVSSLSEGAGKYCTDSTDPGLILGWGLSQGTLRLSQLCTCPRPGAAGVFLYPGIHCPFQLPVGFILLVFAHTFTCLSD